MSKVSFAITVVLLFWSILLVPKQTITVQAEQSVNQFRPYLFGRCTCVNTARLIDFIDLPFIGPKIAEKIISLREQQGSFRSNDELIRVKGIGVKTLTKIQPFLCDI